MAIGAGIGATLGMAAETTYGTYVAPARFYEFNKESLGLKKTTATSAGVAGGQLMPRASRRVVTQREAAGSLDLEVTNKLFGLILQALMGTSVTPVQQGATAAYLQTHTLADTAGKSLTIQKGVPLTTGTLVDKTFVGCKIISAEFSCESGGSGMLMCTIEFDSKDCDETQTLAVASYPAVSPFNFSQMAVKTGTYGAETALDGVRKMSLKFERPQEVGRFYAGQNGLKKEPITNAQVKVTGSLEMDYVATTVDDLHTSDGATSLVWEFIGPIIASTHAETIRFKVPAIKIDDAPPVIEGFDVIKPKFAFSGFYDGTNLVAIEYMSTDTTL
ncbi:phage tail tube protein [Streptomyces sp. NPDC096153]|uniref:phage tail tube protein n=1 Tax=Streptomyces sp. NPDC096153 TaxID=3155548 RepID=UPI00332DBE7B